MSLEKYHLAVILINYKTSELVIDCLETLLPEIRHINGKVIIVDNNSGDNSCELINNWIAEKAVSDKFMLLALAHNYGFSGGNNAGILAIEADYYLLVNSDTLVRKNAIKLLLDEAINDNSAGIISPRLEWRDGRPQKSCFRFHTPMSELIFSAHTGLITKFLYRWNMLQVVSENNDYYDWTSFACVMIKAEVFKDIGRMDDGYFMYFEDVAFCYHANKAGWKILNIPDSHIVHLRGGSSPVKSQVKLRKRLPRYFYESRTRFFYQVYGQFGLLMANICWTSGYFISLIRTNLSSSYKPSVSAYQWQDIWTNFLTPLKAYIHPDNYD